MQQALVVGLGQFGMALARALVDQGDEVLAVDKREDRVQVASSFAAEALAVDATDETVLATLRPASRDLCVCAIGDESREASILVTALMRQMGARRVVARATDELHERILHLVGAHDVLNPEKIMGERVAARLSTRGVVDLVPLGDGLVISEIQAPSAVRGRSLAQLDLPGTVQLTVLAVRRTENGVRKVIMAQGDTRVESGDVLVVVGTSVAARRFAEGP